MFLIFPGAIEAKTRNNLTNNRKRKENPIRKFDVETLMSYLMISYLICFSVRFGHLLDMLRKCPGYVLDKFPEIRAFLVSIAANQIREHVIS